MPEDRDSEWRAVYAACRQAQVEDREIDDGTARTIAAWYQSPGQPDGAAFASTGAIRGDSVWHQLAQPEYSNGSADAHDRFILDMLGTYLVQAGERGPVAGWSRLWVGEGPDYGLLGPEG